MIILQKKKKKKKKCNVRMRCVQKVSKLKLYLPQQKGTMNFHQ